LQAKNNPAVVRGLVATNQQKKEQRAKSKDFAPVLCY
jgi:hypothetical protein